MGFFDWLFPKPKKTVSKTYPVGWFPEYDETLRKQISKGDFFQILASAPDVDVIRPDFKELSKENQLSVLVEFFKQLAFHESGWDTNCQNVDVGTKNNPDSWSIGLLQLSVIDQTNYGLRRGYKFADLLNPTNNLKFGVEILCNQIQKRGKIFIPNHETGNPKAYFATLRPGNRYQKIDKITAVTKAMKFGPNEPEPPKPAGAAPWFSEAKKYEGKKETDPEFNRFMSGKWGLLGLNLGTIKENWAAWCGLAATVALVGVGYSYQKDGALARNWDKYGVEINWKQDGIPQGAIIRTNHSYNCKSESGNHVTMANGDCAPADLMKSGATFSGYGGNQQNTWKVSVYPVKEICSVRWPADAEKPRKITKSVNCSSKSSGAESTR